MRRTIIIGSGQHGRVVQNILNLSKEFHPVLFIDDNIEIYKKEINGLFVGGTINDLSSIKKEMKIDSAIIAIGSPILRIKISEILKNENIELINAIHPTAVIDPLVKLGCGIVIDAGATLSPDPVIGDLVIINPNTSVNHDNTIGLASHLASGVSLGGDVHIGQRTLLGIGASVIPGAIIGDDCIIGVGAAIFKNVKDRSIMVGNPARLARIREEKEIFA